MERGSAPVIAVGLVLSRGVRPVRVHHGDHRPVLPPVRADDRLVDGDLDVQLADARARPWRRCCSSRAARGTYAGAAAGRRSSILGLLGGLDVPGPWLEPASQRRHAGLSSGVVHRSSWPRSALAWVGLARRGRLIGLVVCRPINWLLGAFFDCSIAASTWRPAATPGSSAACCGSTRAACSLVYGGMLA